MFITFCLRALLVSTSSKWFNYRHAANAFAVASVLRANSVATSEIFLAIADDPAYSPRNPFPGKVYIQFPHTENIHTVANLTGDDVSVDSLRALLSHGPIRRQISRITPDRNGRMLLYLTGHGGDEFLKFRNVEELRAIEFAEILTTMKRILNFTELLIIIDTCQAASFFKYVEVSGVTTIASSIVGESSRSSAYDPVLGVPLGDRFTQSLCRILRRLPRRATFSDLARAIRASDFESTPDIRQFNAPRALHEMLIGDFFF
jgi:phosphatidylinositol glycan class K